MTKELIERSRRRHAFADVPLLVLTAALVLSLVVAFTAVSIGIARADTLMPFGGGGSGRLALAMLVGIVDCRHGRPDRRVGAQRQVSAAARLSAAIARGRKA